MSRTLSATLQTEHHVGPTAPAPTPLSDPAAPHGPDPAVTLDAQATLMRRFVVQAIEAPDLATKLELWACYRSARADALAMLGSSPSTSGTRRPHAR